MTLNRGSRLGSYGQYGQQGSRGNEHRGTAGLPIAHQLVELECFDNLLFSPLVGKPMTNHFGRSHDFFSCFDCKSPHFS